MNKKVYLLGALLIVVVAIIVLQEQISNKKPVAAEIKILPAVSEKSIGAITIQEGKATIALRKKGDVWVVSKQDAGTEPQTTAAPFSALAPDSGEVTPVAGTAVVYQVDSASITAAVEKLSSLEKTTLISENPEKQKIFEVDTVKGIRVVVFDGADKKIGTIIIGKNGSDYNSNYVRQLGSNSVYMASGGIRSAFFTDLTRWRNKSILTFDKSTVQGLVLAKNDGSMITIAHSDSGNPWQIIAPIKNPAKTETVETILEKLSNLAATDFQDQKLADTAMGFNAPELGLTVSFKNGSSRNIVFGKMNADKKYWVKVEGKEQIYLIGEFTVNQVNKNLDDLKGEPLVKTVPTDPKN